MKFGNWDESIHNGAEQTKRFEKSKKSDVKPLSVDKEKQTCLIQGSGKEPYYVTLDTCTCSDFTRRKLPCKHIYRLANELGLGTDNFMSGINRKELDRLMFTLPVDIQELLYDMCKSGDDTKFLLKKELDTLPLIVNGFCIESTDDFYSAAEQTYCAKLRELIAESGLDNLPKPKVQYKTLLSWFKQAEQEQLDKMQNVFTALELTPEAIELRHTISRRFEKRFIKEEYWSNEYITISLDTHIRRFIQDE